MGQGKVRVFQMLFPNKEDGFETLFFECLDSWFTTDIACCDACYDDFAARWPGIYLRDLAFQRNSISLDSFHEGSDLADVFTQDEFRKLLPRINCPRCGAPLAANMWPYNFPFNQPEGFEEHAGAIAAIVNTTPFLVLENPFAQRVLSEIRQLATSVATTRLGTPCYRGRKRKDIRSPTDTAEFGPPSASATPEGRYNHAGKPVLYLASDVDTCLLEVDSPADGAYVAEAHILRPVRVLDLAADSLPSDILSALIASSLLSATPENRGWERVGYAFSRFVADCARSSGYDGIKYPSVRAATGYNLVLFQSGLRWTDLVRIGVGQFHTLPQRSSRLHDGGTPAS